MALVEEFYDQLELRQKVDKRRIFLASEVPDVYEEARKKYPQYEVISNVQASVKANKLNTRYALDSFLGAVTDLYMMSLCDYVVCTLSSNICRIVLEKMQTTHPDAHHLVKSLDSLYFNWGEDPVQGKVVHESQETRKNNLKIGELVVIEKYFNLYGHYQVRRPNGTSIKLIPRWTVELVDLTAEFPVVLPV
jgi:glycoprotein 6-alpha-L-fucosyltransferase